jgi:hypothetical protein
MQGAKAMPFGTLKSLEDVARAYQISLRVDDFIQPISYPVSEHLQKRLQLFLKNAPLSVSEEAVCEFLIAPILQEIWLSYLDSLMLWSHASFGEESPLTGYPDYFFSKRSPLGPVRDQPYVLFVEAKRDDFDAAWAQCLSAMLAAQKLNHHPVQTIFGGVSNGRVWRFAKLEGQLFTQDSREFTLSHLPELFAALHYVFEQSKELALAA